MFTNNLKIEFALGTDVGLQREHNEDVCLARPELGLWLVADGMGGHQAGEVASALARDTVVNSVVAGLSLVDALAAAHEAIKAQSSSSANTLEMGTTMVALQIRESSFEVAWVGDSRAYLHTDTLVALTQDHSHVQALVEQGLITAAQARVHPHRSMVLQALGVNPAGALRIDRITGDLRPGMQILLCSDGLTDRVEDDEIARILAQPGSSPQGCVDQLIRAALDAGGRDNITIIVLRCSNARG